MVTLSSEFPQPTPSSGGFNPMRGRKTGRPSPRVPLRAAARELTLSAHGLMEPGRADPNQGQLFATTPYEESPHQTARRVGAAPPMASSMGGFMADVEATPARSAHQRKAEALKSFTQTRGDNPLDVRSASPQAQHMEHLHNLRDQAQRADWYTSLGQGSGGGVGEGSSVQAVRHASERTGFGMNEMTRATANISPRVPWTMGNPQYRSMPNVTSSVNVAKNVKSEMQASGRRSFSEGEIGKMGERAGGIALPLSKQRAAAALAAPGETTRPIPTGENYAKVPNFNESLSVGRGDLPAHLRGAYGGAYTSDMWDLQAKNLPENFHSRQGQYSVDKMLSTRTAFKRRELPPDFQAAVWEHVRNRAAPEPLTASVETAPGKYRNMPSLFSDEPGSSRLSPSFDMRTPSGAVHDRRSATARRLGIEF